MLNHGLADTMDVKKGPRAAINEMHEQLYHLFENIDQVIAEIGHEAVADFVKMIEFKLQEAWGFEQNEAFHCWWWKIPYCTCPKLDNQERTGTGYNILSADCPYHGVK